MVCGSTGHSRAHRPLSTAAWSSPGVICLQQHRVFPTEAAWETRPGFPGIRGLWQSLNLLSSGSGGWGQLLSLGQAGCGLLSFSVALTTPAMLRRRLPTLNWRHLMWAQGDLQGEGITHPPCERLWASVSASLACLLSLST